jgi:hypothetical protein
MDDRFIEALNLLHENMEINSKATRSMGDAFHARITELEVRVNMLERFIADNIDSEEEDEQEYVTFH